VLPPLYNSKRSYITYNLNQEDMIAMTETILGVPHTGNYLDKNALQVEYNKYVEKLKESGEAGLNIKRFERGVTLVGMYYEKGGYGSNPLTCYFIGDATINDREFELQSPLKRYANLDESPELNTVAMMSRTYMQSKSTFHTSNAFGIGLMDAYIEDLDISVGYRDNKYQWIIIPKEMPNA